jgi:hypothetical protein
MATGLETTCSGDSGGSVSAPISLGKVSDGIDLDALLSEALDDFLPPFLPFFDLLVTKANASSVVS